MVGCPLPFPSRDGWAETPDIGSWRHSDWPHSLGGGWKWLLVGVTGMLLRKMGVASMTPTRILTFESTLSLM